MRRAVVRFAGELLTQFLSEGSGPVEIVSNGLPAGARLVGCRLDPFQGNVVEMLFESEAFEDVAGPGYPTLPAPSVRRPEPESWRDRATREPLL